MVLFLGDGVTEALSYMQGSGIPCVAVSGNCDFESAMPEECIFELEGHRILVTHGHRQRVKEGPHHLVNYAKAKGCDIAIFGHTHERCDLYVSDTYVFNPGSLGEPRRGNPSFGHLNISSQGVLFSHGELPAEY
jgi:putative phosphoesterase